MTASNTPTPFDTLFAYYPPAMVVKILERIQAKVSAANSMEDASTYEFNKTETEQLQAITQAFRANIEK